MGGTLGSLIGAHFLSCEFVPPFTSHVLPGRRFGAVLVLFDTQVFHQMRHEKRVMTAVDGRRPPHRLPLGEASGVGVPLPMKGVVHPLADAVGEVEV